MRLCVHGGESMRKKDSLLFSKPPVVLAWAAVGGKKESEGPLGSCLDAALTDNTLGEESWETAESDLQRRAVQCVLHKAATGLAGVDIAFAGDLQAQCTASAYTLRALDVPFAGLYGACSTMAESLGMAACFCGSGLAGTALALTSSHFCAAERQFRTPLNYGGKRTPTAQWTATAAGCCLLGAAGKGPRVAAVTFGRVRDYQVSDINNMGAAMAPAAAQTILNHLQAMGTLPNQYDCIYTGDLGQVGSTLLAEILHREGIALTNHQDCGLLLYQPAFQQVHAGGSGCGCSAAVLCAHILPQLAAGKQKRVLFAATGALMSQTTFLQGESIPGIAHCVELLCPAEGESKL